MMRAPIAVVMVLVLLMPAFAHDSWISRGGLKNGAGEWCCGDGDCAVMDAGAVQQTAHGLHFNGVGRIGSGVSQVVETYNELVPSAEVMPISPDGKWVRCKRPDGTRRCVFGPPPGS